MSYGGRRLYYVPKQYLFKPCEYGRAEDGAWHGCTPNGEQVNLSAHEVVEHADGAISVSPSIRAFIPAQPQYQRPERELWHGFLEHGVWRDC